MASVLYELPIPAGTTLADLLPLSEELTVLPTPALDAAARREAEEALRALGPALLRPHRWEGLETFHIFLVRAFEERIPAVEVLARAPPPGSSSARPAPRRSPRARRPTS